MMTGKETAADPVHESVEEVASDLAELLPPELLDEAKAFVEDALAAHPVGARLAERVRPRDVERSGDELKDGLRAAEEAPPKRRRGDAK